MKKTIEDPHWFKRANCTEATDGEMFPGIGQSAKPAIQKYCEPCPVRRDCLEDNLDQNTGIWGGLSARERRILIKQRLESSSE